MEKKENAVSDIPQVDFDTLTANYKVKCTFTAYSFSIYVREKIILTKI